MDSLKGLLSKKMKGNSVLAKQVRASLIVEAADNVLHEIWGNKIKAKTGYLRGSVLTIYVFVTIMAQEIRFKQAKIIEMINKEVGDDAVSKIRTIEKAIDKIQPIDNI